MSNDKKHTRKLNIVLHIALQKLKCYSPNMYVFLIRMKSIHKRVSVDYLSYTCIIIKPLL